MMSKHYIPRRLSHSELKSIDHKARKRIEELYFLTDEIVNGYHDMNNKYDHKLYKKYKELKGLNKKLQEKLINQHCSGCKCHNQLNNEIDNQHTDNSPLSAPQKIATTSKINRKNLLSDTESENTQNDNQTNSTTVLEISSDDDDDAEVTMITDENVSKVTANDNQMKEKAGDEGNISHLPAALQLIIRDKVKKSKNTYGYLLNIGSQRLLCKFLTDKSYSLGRLPNKSLVRLFVSKHFELEAADMSEPVTRICEELREIHQLYMLKLKENPPPQYQPNKTTKRRKRMWC